jgi:ribosome-binding factor A
MTNVSIKDRKKAQRESLLYQELSKLLHNLMVDHPNLTSFTLTRVSLSSDGGICSLYFYIAGGIEEFKEKVSSLILYKPSLRKAIAQKIARRYTPELVFKFDEHFEKQERLENLLSKIAKDDSSQEK